MVIRTTYARESTITAVTLTNTSKAGRHPKDQYTCGDASCRDYDSIWPSQH